MTLPNGLQWIIAIYCIGLKPNYILEGDYVMEEQEEMYTDKKANGKTDGTKHKSEHSVHNTHT